MKRILTFAAVALMALPALPAGAQEGFGACGNITLIFMNQDLRPRDDGFVHVSGTFFIQFQAIGADASRVAKVAFSFGKPFPDGVAACDTPVEPATGAYVRNYRSDADAADGFFVPINTTLVPDDTYGAAITAFDASGAYLAQFYTKAIVENGPNCFPQRTRCEDHVLPWAMILPGDGNQTNEVGGITIEFAEPVVDVQVKINGEQVIPQPWEPPARDDDAIPDNDGEECTTPEELRFLPVVCRRVVWGSGFRVDREPAVGDVIEVKAIDTSGNEHTKTVNVGGSTQGGTIELATPELQVSADLPEQAVEAGETAEYRLKLVNVGQGNAEARMTVSAPEGVATEWSNPTIAVPSGAEEFVILKATPGQDLRPGGYTLQVKAIYKSGTEDVEKSLALALKVEEFRPVPVSPLRQTRANSTAADDGADDQPRRSPGAEPVLLLGAIAVLVLVERRRRA
jgi:hypothetical protein